MAPFRPSNINKRAYPGNANVVGPTTLATLGITTTQCCACISTLCGPTQTTWTLGCRCQAVSCACCQCCCCCSCTVCDRTVPGGMYKTFQQYEAKTRDAWGDDNCVTGSSIGFCGPAGTLQGGNVDCKGFALCNSAGTVLLVAPSCTEASANWYNSGNGVTKATQCMGDLGWFVPAVGCWSTPIFPCRSYWDTTGGAYWTSTQRQGGHGCYFDMTNGGASGADMNNSYPIRAFRNV